MSLCLTHAEINKEPIILGLAELRRLPSTGALGSGIYFLWLDADLLYIGKSRTVESRITSHEYARRYGRMRSRPTKSIPFDRFTCLTLSRDEFIPHWIDDALRVFERAYIDRYSPPFNCPFANPGT